MLLVNAIVYLIIINFVITYTFICMIDVEYTCNCIFVCSFIGSTTSSSSGNRVYSTMYSGMYSTVFSFSSSTICSGMVNCTFR